MRLMMIVNQPELAKYLSQHGVDRIFVDLENLGKQERQGHRDTWLSCHKMTDISLVREAIGTACLLVRLNPWHDRSADEIEEAISRGADMLMLPMFRRIDEVADFARAVNERVPFIPLAETAEALEILPQVARLPGVNELYIGLNDLHLSLRQRFMFQPLADGTLDRAAEQLQAVGMPFGFGGLARVGEGILPAERIIGEHVRLGSSSVILSRTFHRQAPTLTALRHEMDFPLEIAKLRKAVAEYKAADPSTLAANKMEVQRIVDKIASDVCEQH